MLTMKPEKLGRPTNLSIPKYWGEIIAVALVYIVSARIGQLFSIEPGNVTPVWMPSGLMLAWVLIRGRYVWPGVFLGAFVGNVWAYADFSSLSMTIASLSSGSANGLGDAVCSVGSAYCFTLFNGDGNPFKSLKAFLLLFLFGVLLGPLLSALVGVSALLATGFLTTGSYGISLFTWFLGDAVGVLVFTPMLLTYFFPRQERSKKISNLEIVIFVTTLFLIPFIGFFPDILSTLRQQQGLLFVPVFLWGVLRMNQIVIFNSVGYFSVLLIIASYFGAGLIEYESQFESVLILQLYIIVTISSVFILSSLVNEKELLLRQLQESYNHDSLTKIFTRKYWENRLDEEIERKKRYGSPFCMIMYDIDHFKNVNDNYGHGVGDKVLVELSELVSTDIRDVDVLARWGGEEFVILLPQTRLVEAGKIAERIRSHVEKTALLPNEVLTISLGVIEFAADCDRDQQLNRLDEALYDAKDSGRNQVKCVQN
jgi:diguanylate cyclase (GGDEF)-like protein